jgi:hypothetical protein
MLVGTMGGAASFALTLLMGPETRGREMVPDLVSPEDAFFRFAKVDAKRVVVPSPAKWGPHDSLPALSLLARHPVEFRPLA